MATAAHASPIGTDNKSLVLGLLIERPSYPYEIAQRGRLATSSAYVAFQALEDAGLIEVSHRIGSPRQPKVIYRATAAGIREHRASVAARLAIDQRRIEVKGKLLRAHGDPDALLAVLDAYERETLAAAEHLRTLPAHARLHERIAALHEEVQLTAQLDFIKRARALAKEENR